MKDTVTRLYDEVFNAARPEVADQIVAPAFVVHGTPRTDARGPEAIKATERLLRAAFPDLHFTLDDMIAEGDRVAVRWSMRGTHRAEFMGVPATGRQVCLQACVIFRIENGCIAELWPVIDHAGLLQQLHG